MGVRSCLLAIHGDARYGVALGSRTAQGLSVRRLLLTASVVIVEPRIVPVVRRYEDRYRVMWLTHHSKKLVGISGISPTDLVCFGITRILERY